MNTQQPNALHLAHSLSGGKLIDNSTEWADTLHAAAAELRRQHARIAELEAQLSAIGAGGVEAPAAPVSTYVEALERVKLTDDEVRNHALHGSAYWDNAVTACICAVINAHRKGEES